MKRKLLALLCCLLCLLFSLGTLTASAESSADATAQAQTQAQAIAESIYTFAQEGTTTQEWISTTLSAQAGVGAEWYILCLAQSGNYDFTAYEQALLSYLDKNTVPSATTKQKYALMLAAIGSTDAYISQTLDSTVGTLGVMSYVYGLHLANNGYKTPMHVERIVDEILSLQKQDGGWAVSGSGSDADVTAMTLQALAPYRDAQNVSTAIDRALALLSDKQTARGGFVSYGVENPESAAQVIIALCALGIDPCTDTRFIKNGGSLFDAMAHFALSEGGYAHVEGGAYSAAATAQVLCAATAYLRFAQGSTPLYDLDGARPGEVQTAPESSENPTAPQAPVPDASPESNASGTLSYKPIACAVVLVLGVAVCIVLIALGKKHYKNFIALGLAVAVLIAAIMLIDIRTPEDYYNGESATKQNPIGSVTLTVRCDAVPGLADIEHLPADGIILATETYQIEAGETVYDILIEASRKHGLHVDVSGVGESAYVRGIAYLYEQEHGALSGWNYKVNGAIPSMGCAAYTLSDGDEIVWEYTLTVGQ